MKILVLQHTAWEGPGHLLTKAAEKNGVTLEVVEVWKDWLPSFAQYDGIIVLGGSPNVDQEEQYPFLVEEKRYLKRAIAADTPILGFCLGHQLLAHVLGAQIGPNFKPSIGFVKGHITHDGREHPAFASLAKIVPLFKWHSQAVLEPLPKSISLLATSAQCQVEAFSLTDRPHIMGVQCDNHAANLEDIMTWLEKDWQWLASFRSLIVKPADLLSEATKLQERLDDDFQKFFTGYVSLLS